MTVLDAVEEHIMGLAQGTESLRPEHITRAFQALNTVGTSVMQSLSQWPVVVRAEGARWVSLSSSK